MKNKTMRRAMISSIIALTLCFAMLVGTTYAWFTDSVTSANNIIKSGTLDVSMYWANGTEDPGDANTTWTDASTGAIFNYDLWEPGYVDVRHIRISNDGTLALKYKLQITPNGAASILADVIDVYFADPAVQVADRAALAGATRLGTLTEVLAGMGTTYGTNHLLAGQSVDVTLALKMQESAGNEYQNLSIGTDFSVVLLATQYTAETDSFDDQYDANALYPDVTAVFNGNGLATAFAQNVANGESTITLSNDIDDGDGLFLSAASATNPAQTVTVDLNNKELTFDGPAVGSAGTATQALHLEKGNTVVLKDGTIKANSSDIKMLVQNYADLTLDNVVLDYTGSGRDYALSNNFGNVVVKNGTQILVDNGKTAFDLWYGMSDVYDAGVTVTFDETFTGTVDGDIEYGAKAGGAARNPNWKDVTVLTIKGNGLFTGNFVNSGNCDPITDANIVVYSGRFVNEVPAAFIDNGSSQVFDGTYWVVSID